MLSKLSIKRPVTTVMVLLMVVLGGIIAYTSLNLAYMPSVDIPVALVMTSYTGAGPEEMEELVTKPIEEAMASISNVDKITSTSSTGSSTVIIQFVDGTDIDMSAIDIREKVDMVKRRLPEDATDPIVYKIDMNAQSIDVGITSDTLDLSSLNDLLEDEISNKLERIEGVSSVSFGGGIDNEIEIVVDPDKMQGYGISISSLAQALRAENANLPSGELKQGDKKLQIRAVGEFESIEDIKNIQIQTGVGSIVKVSDVATVNQVEKEKSSYSLVNGKEGIIVSLDKQSTANVVDVTDKINKELDEIRQQYPDLNITMLTDTADYIKLSINNVTSTAFQSALVAVLIIFIFLRDTKTSLIIGVSIPTSIVATFALMYVFGMSLNTISMGGITIGIGMLVDNSVVVLENIFKHWKNGLEPKKAAEVGAQEVGLAVMASTLTTVAVFLPMIFIKGIIGQMLRDLALTICFSLSASLVVSLTFVPMACSKILKSEDEKKQERKGPITRALDAWGKCLDGIDLGYKKLLEVALHNRKKTVLISLLIFIASLMVVPQVGMELMPSSDEGVASISIELPKGVVIEETQKVLNEVIKRIEGIPETEMVYASVGGGMMSSGTNAANVSMNFVKLKDRKRSTDEIVLELRERLKGISGAQIKVSASDEAMGPSMGSGVSINLIGDDTDLLKQTSSDLVKMLSEIEGLTNIESSLEDSIPEARVVINRAKAAEYGISTSSISNTISSAVTGTVATTYKINGTEIDVRVRYDKNSLDYINDLRNLTITSSKGSTIPITEVAEIKIDESAVAITRENQKRYISLTADTTGLKDASTLQKEIEAKFTSYIFPEGSSYEFAGSMEMMADSFRSLGIALIVAVLLIYMIMASQFEALLSPFIIMFSMPMAITGGILGLFIAGQPISVTAFMGFIMLVGMVVNNAIVLVDYANQLMEKKELSILEAFIEAGPSRLRPILMTTLTTVIGLIPLALATAEGMEMQQPLGIAVIFGLTLSTLITLVLVPVLCVIVDNLRPNNRKKRKAEKKAAKLAKKAAKSGGQVSL